MAQLKSFNFVFWICNIMEMLERLAYYGLRTVLPVYMVLAIEEGGPEFTHVQKGLCYAWWAVIQSGIPIVSGGYADRYGYKLTIGIAIAIKIIGYIVMAYAVELASWLTSGESAGAAGHEAVFCLFCIGAYLLALGTAIFKPGIQGIYALQLNEKNSSTGWSVFYQLVNVGGFLGPILAGYLRFMQWRYVFLACAVIVSLNYLLFFTFKDPELGLDEDAEKDKFRKLLSMGTLLLSGVFASIGGVISRVTGDNIGITDWVMVSALGILALILLPFGISLFLTSFKRLSAYASEIGKGEGWSTATYAISAASLLPIAAAATGAIEWSLAFNIAAGIFALNLLGGFMFEELPDDYLPPLTGSQQFIKVLWDSTLGIFEPRLMGFLVIFSGFWAMFYQLFDLLPNYISDWVDGREVAKFFADPVPAEWGGHYPQEYMININAGMCMIFAFIIGYYMGKVRSMVAMIMGMAVASLAIWSLGFTMNGWYILFAIAAFSMGELMSSPTKMRYFSGLAPKGKKALYLGYINATSGIGWALGSVIAGKMYDEGGDKIVLARKYLIEKFQMSAETVNAMKKTDVLPALTEKTGKDVEAIRELLFNHYDPSFVWDHFALIGVASMIGLILFDRVTYAKLGFKKESIVLMLMTGGIATWTYGIVPGLTFGGCIAIYLLYSTYAPDLLPGGASGDAEAEASEA
ncbi:MAG: MFS transporter [Myxococcota bacterium]|nr:MFS transporter [Myxococcota bacterium]